MKPAPTPSQLVFSCDFGHGLSAVITVDPTAVSGDKPVGSVLECRWSGPLPRTPAGRRKVLRDYVAWKTDVMQDVADRTGKRILDLVQVDRETVIARHFEPANLD